MMRGEINLSNNVGYLSSKSNADTDENYTPFYAVDPIIKYIPHNWTVWCPFDEMWSAYVQQLVWNGNTVIRSHLNDGKDFFTYEPEQHYDCIISNPPFSIKDKILERLYELDKPFAILLPMNSLQGVSRYKFFKQGIQLLSFDQRVGFHNPSDMRNPVEGSPFASAYFCRNLLPSDLIVEELHKYSRNLDIFRPIGGR